jgi:exopolysaccharide production protein ExoZ
MGQAERPARLMGLQQLRGIAALGVVVFHASELGGLPFLPGAFGVDLFFVLSGFLMVAITGETTRPGAFLAARFRRVAPLYWLATLTLAAGLAIVGPAPDPVRVASALAFLPQGNAGPTAMGLPVLSPGWSLHYEVGFYALFAATLVLPLRSRTPLLSALLLALAAIGATGWRTAWTDPILIEFAAGLWLGEVWRGRADARTVAIGIVAVMLAFALTMPGLLDRVRLFAATLAIAAMAWTLAKEPVRPRPRLEALGDASYAIYLAHLLAMKPMFSLATGVPPVLLIAPAIVIGVALGLAVHRWIERPIARALDPSRIRARSRVGRSRPSVPAAP